MFQTTLRTAMVGAICAAAMAMSAAQAAPVTAPNTGGPGVVHATPDIEIFGVGGVSTAGPLRAGLSSTDKPRIAGLTARFSTGRNASARANMNRMFMAPMGFGRKHSGRISAGRSAGRSAYSTAAGSRNTRRGPGVYNAAQPDGFAMPAYNYNTTYGSYSASNWNVVSRDIKVHDGGKILGGNDDWSYLNRKSKHSRSTNGIPVEHEMREAYVEYRENTCAGANQELGANMNTNARLGFGDQLASITSALFEEFVQLGRVIACLM